MKNGSEGFHYGKNNANGGGVDIWFTVQTLDPRTQLPVLGSSIWNPTLENQFFIVLFYILRTKALYGNDH